MKFRILDIDWANGEEYFDSLENYVYDDRGVQIEQYRIAWSDNNQVVSDCRNGKPLKVAKFNLIRNIQDSLRRSGVRFVLFFDGKSVILNKMADAIVITAQPVLKVKYIAK